MFVVDTPWGVSLFFGLEERIPSRKLRGFLIQEFERSCGDILLVDHEAEEVIVKPFVSHN